jgi:hypothetical protein
MSEDSSHQAVERERMGAGRFDHTLVGKNNDIRRVRLHLTLSVTDL